MKSLLVNLRDTRFILYDMLAIENFCRSKKFEDHSRETFEMVIDAAEKLATKDFAPANSDGDTTGCKWRDGVVEVPPSFREPFRRYCEGGWSACPRTMRSGGSVSR